MPVKRWWRLLHETELIHVARDARTFVAIKRRDHGAETLAEIGRSYNVSGWTISRLAQLVGGCVISQASIWRTTA